MDSKVATIEHEFDFIGGQLCLDFANTWGGLPADSTTQERLTTYARLVSWTQQAKLLSESEAEVLLRKAEGSQGAAAILERAIVLREAIREIFLAVYAGEVPNKANLDLLNRELALGMVGARVILSEDGFDWEWRREEGALDQMLGFVARSAAMLLTSAELKFVRKCANELCRWLFVDTTKNHRRQWCRASGCGNLARVRKHRERQRSHEESD